MEAIELADGRRLTYTVHGLGADESIVGGSSGGGPHALACAARTPGCRAATSVVGVAPWRGEETLAGMGEDNVVEFTAAMQGPTALRAGLDEAAAGMGELTAQDFVDGFGSLLPEVDRRALTGELAEDLTADLRGALSTQAPASPLSTGSVNPARRAIVKRVDMWTHGPT